MEDGKQQESKDKKTKEEDESCVCTDQGTDGILL